jgi:serine/threonine-protein kinase
MARPAAPAASSGTGVLRLNSLPWSQVTVDGKPVGNTPLMNLPLPAGAHTIRMVNPDMGLTKTIKVTVKAGDTTTKVVNMAQ